MTEPGWTDPRAAEILDVVAQETNVDRALLTPQTSMDSLGIPSLDLVQAIFALETRFNIELPVNENQTGQEFATVRDLVTHVTQAIDAQHPPA